MEDTEEEEEEEEEEEMEDQGAVSDRPEGRTVTRVVEENLQWVEAREQQQQSRHRIRDLLSQRT